MSLADFLRRVIGVLDNARLPYMLTGSLAAAFHATPRATQDVDVVVAPDESAVMRAVDEFLKAGYYVDPDAAREALRSRGQFNAIDPATGWKIDLIVQKDRPFSRTEFERRTHASLLGVEVELASLEDILLAKLEWAELGDSELQRRDAAQILDRAGEGVDLEYVNHWVRELGLADEWDRARSSREEDDRP